MEKNFFAIGIANTALQATVVRHQLGTMKPTLFMLLGLAVLFGAAVPAGAQTFGMQAHEVTNVAVVGGGQCRPSCIPSTTTSKTWVTMASTQLSLQQSSLITARFTAGSTCTALYTLLGKLTPGYCSVRILANVGSGGAFVEMSPQIVSHYQVFQGHGQGTESFSIERSINALAGTLRVMVQIRVPFGDDGRRNFRLEGWLLSVQAARL